MDALAVAEDVHRPLERLVGKPFDKRDDAAAGLSAAGGLRCARWSTATSMSSSAAGDQMMFNVVCVRAVSALGGGPVTSESEVTSRPRIEIDTREHVFS